MRKLAILVSSIGLTAGMVNGQNLLLNGDFNSPNTVSAPDNWSVWSWGSGWANHQNDGSSFDGSYYMAVGATDWGSGGGGVYQTVAGITAGVSYDLTVEAGAQAWWKPVGYMTMFWLDGTGAQISQSQLQVINPSDYNIGAPWANYSLTAEAPAGAAQVKVEFANYDGQGTVWYDNATLTMVPEPGTLALAGLGAALLGVYSRRNRRS